MFFNQFWIKKKIDLQLLAKNRRPYRNSFRLSGFDFR